MSGNFRESNCSPGAVLLGVMFLTLLVAAATAAEPSASISPDSDRLAALRSVDQAAGTEIATRFAATTGLEKVTIQISGGVVRLAGEVADDFKRQLAGKIAADVPGVIHVDNQLAMDTDVAVRMAPMLILLEDKSRQVIRALPLFLAAAFIVFVFWWAGGWLVRRKLFVRKVARQPFLGVLLRQAVRLAALLVGLLLALDLLNATALLGALLGTAGIVGIALGFAFRDVAENYIAGVLLSLRQPFLPNDHVVIDGREGRVAGLNSRATILLTLDGNHLRMPNAQVFKGVILNYTRNPTRRFSFTLGVSNDADLGQVSKLGREVLAAMPDVLVDPGPTALIADAGESSMTMRFNGWMDQRSAGFGKVRSEAIRLVKSALDQAGIEMPDPGYRIELRQPASSAQEPTSESPPTALVQGDVSPVEHVSKTIDEERAKLDQPDLLDPSAPRE